jgi:REP element-mobilizing transposase RayT
MTQRRIYQCSFPYFVTFNTAFDVNMFDDIRFAEMLYKIILDAGELKNHFVYQFCIMPDHVHILCKTKPPIPQSGFSNPRCGSDNPRCGIVDLQYNCDCGQIHKYHISDYVKSIRGTFSRTIHKGQIWQPRFYDQIIEHEKRLAVTIDYIKNNPIKADLSKKYQKYPYQFINDELINDLF